MSGVTIRDARLEDSAAIANLMCELGYNTTPTEMVSRLQPILTNRSYKTLVAVSDGGVCGMIGTIFYPSYEHNTPSARIVALVVSTEMRGRGIGRQLVEALESELPKNRITQLAVNTQLTRKEAHKFYEALGFERNGYRFVKNLA
jgi:N-acetylglutamate synthase-like GNAT family acetyltransferase